MITNPGATYITINAVHEGPDRFIQFDVAYAKKREYPSLDNHEEWTKIYTEEEKLAQARSSKPFDAYKMWEKAYKINKIVIIGAIIGAGVISLTNPLAAMGVVTVSGLSTLLSYRKTVSYKKRFLDFQRVCTRLSNLENSAKETNFYEWAKQNNLPRVHTFREFIAWLEIYNHSGEFHYNFNQYLSLTEEKEKLEAAQSKNKLSQNKKYIQIKEKLSECLKTLKEFDCCASRYLDDCIRQKRENRKIDTVEDIFTFNIDLKSRLIIRDEKQLRSVKIARVIYGLIGLLLLSGAIAVACTVPMAFTFANYTFSILVGSAGVGTLLIGNSIRLFRKANRLANDINEYKKKKLGFETQQKMCNSKEFKSWIGKYNLALTPLSLLHVSNGYLLELQTKLELKKT